MDYSLKRIWNLISFFGIFLISIDLFSLIFLASTSPNFNHYPIDESYQNYLIKYQIIFIFISLWIFRRYRNKSTILTSSIIWFFCLINALLSRVSSLQNAGNIYDLPIIIFIFCILTSSLLLMILSK